MSVKPITLWGHASGPNPWKVAMILEELGLPYDQKFLEFSELKKDPYESLNPNGRVPTIEDPNTGLSIWESAAIIDYLLETYDKGNKLTPTDAQKKWAARSWRDFQISGQGPYFGQLIWFTKYHPEKVQSAIDRYRKEILRVIGVIDRHLAKHKTQYLTGDEVTYADIMWAPWFKYPPELISDVDFAKEFPTWNSWWQKIRSRPSVDKIYGEWKAAMAA